MATLLDLGLLERFGAIFVAILIYAVVLGFLSYAKVIESLALRNIIAIFLAILAIFIPGLIQLVMFIGPWAAVFMIIALLILVFVKFLGATDADISHAMKEKALVWWIIIVFIIIFLAGVGKVYFAKGEFLEKTRVVEGIEVEGIAGTAERGELQFWQTLFHPYVLGMLLVILIAAFAVALMGSGPEEPLK